MKIDIERFLTIRAYKMLIDWNERKLEVVDVNCGITEPAAEVDGETEQGIMDKIFDEDRHLEEPEITPDDHTLIQSASYEEGEEWVVQYREQFDTKPSFF